MKTQWIALTWWALFVPATLDAQPAEVGERVRVGTTDGARRVGAFIEITPSDLGLRHDDGFVRIPLAQVQTLERSLGRRRRFGRTFLITTGVGALALGTFAAAADDGTCNDQPFGCLDAGGAFVIGSIVGAIYSAPIGLILGLTIRSEAWERVPFTLPGSASLSLTPLGGGRVALRASVPVGVRAR